MENQIKTDGSFDLIDYDVDLIVFPTSQDYYLPKEDIVVDYHIGKNVITESRDWIGIFNFGSVNLQNYISFEWASDKPINEDNSQLRRVIFLSSSLTQLSIGNEHLYQFLYVTQSKQLLGVSKPFCIRDRLPVKDCPYICQDVSDSELTVVDQIKVDFDVKSLSAENLNTNNEIQSDYQTSQSMFINKKRKRNKKSKKNGKILLPDTSISDFLWEKSYANAFTETEFNFEAKEENDNLESDTTLVEYPQGNSAKTYRRGKKKINKVKQKSDIKTFQKKTNYSNDSDSCPDQNSSFENITDDDINLDNNILSSETLESIDPEIEYLFSPLPEKTETPEKNELNELAPVLNITLSDVCSKDVTHVEYSSKDLFPLVAFKDIISLNESIPVNFCENKKIEDKSKQKQEESHSESKNDIKKIRDCQLEITKQLQEDLTKFIALHYDVEKMIKETTLSCMLFQERALVPYMPNELISIKKPTTEPVNEEYLLLLMKIWLLLTHPLPAITSTPHNPKLAVVKCRHCDKLKLTLQKSRQRIRKINLEIRGLRQELEEKNATVALKSVIIDEFSRQVRGLVLENTELTSSNERLKAKEGSLVDLKAELQQTVAEKNDFLLRYNTLLAEDIKTKTEHKNMEQNYYSVQKDMEFLKEKIESLKSVLKEKTENCEELNGDINNLLYTLYTMGYSSVTDAQGKKNYLRDVNGLSLQIEGNDHRLKKCMVEDKFQKAVISSQMETIQKLQEEIDKLNIIKEDSFDLRQDAPTLHPLSSDVKINFRSKPLKHRSDFKVNDSVPSFDNCVNTRSALNNSHNKINDISSTFVKLINNSCSLKPSGNSSDFEKLIISSSAITKNLGEETKSYQMKNNKENLHLPKIAIVTPQAQPIIAEPKPIIPLTPIPNFPRNIQQDCNQTQGARSTNNSSATVTRIHPGIQIFRNEKSSLTQHAAAAIKSTFNHIASALVDTCRQVATQNSDNALSIVPQRSNQTYLSDFHNTSKKYRESIINGNKRKIAIPHRRLKSNHASTPSHSPASNPFYTDSNSDLNQDSCPICFTPFHSWICNECVHSQPEIYFT